MAHHYGEFYISYDFPKHLAERGQLSGSVDQEKSEQKEEVKEAECSNTTK